MSIERTFIMIKPDAIKAGKIGKIISRIEDKGYRIQQAELMTLTPDVVRDHYAHLLDKVFYPKLEAYILSGPVLAMVIEGESAIEGMRRLMGPTNSSRS